MRNWLEKIRINKNMSQKDVAISSNISEAYYSYIENGKRNVPARTAKKIAEVLDFSWTRFFE